MKQSCKKQAIIILLIILAIAIFFRFYKLAEIPPGLYPDVAMNGTNALEAIKTGDFKVFYPENNGREGLFMNLIALSFIIFGPSILAIKIVPAFFGTLTVLGLYLLTKNLFDKNSNNQQANSNIENSKPFEICNLDFGIYRGEAIALLSTFFLAVSFWHVNFSRLGFRAIMAPFFLVWSLYFLFKGINNGPDAQIHPNGPNKNLLISCFCFLASGLFFGLGFHTYIAFRIAPLILAPIFIIEIIKHWPRLKLGRWIIFSVFLIAAASPLAYYYVKNPADFMGRAGQVSVFAAASPIKTLAQSTLKTLGQFIILGDQNWRHNLSGSPQIFWPLIPLFIIGIIYSLRQILKIKNYRQKDWPLITCHWTLLVWWGAMLLPSILTSEGLPHALRSITAIPPSYIFTGLGAYLLIKSCLQKIRSQKIIAVGLLIFLITIAALEYHRYFIYWGENQETKGAFTQRFADQANYLNSLNPAIKKYVIVNEPGTPVPWPDGLPMPAQTIIFLTNAHDPQNKIEYLKANETQKLSDYLINSSGGSPIVVLPMAPDQTLLANLKDRFPGGQIEKKQDFTIFKINF
jgi:4-amino-4-deoxy-L-arabinose transferase-like glycosyltransferase